MAMNRILKKQVTSLKKGTIIKGKWHLKSYEIKGKLGEGAIGSVYLCQANGKIAALKISEKQTSMTMEVNVLKALKQVRGNRLGPVLLDVDDWVAPNGVIYSFYVMEYIKGESMERFIRTNGAVWIGPLLLQLIENLEGLHNAGWVFGDLKPDNLIVSVSPPKVRLVDVGGTTQIGRSIKEYTEFYDRGYWGMGSRRAEPSYDLFSLAMVFLQIYYPHRFKRPESSGGKFLSRKIDQVKELRPYAGLFKKAIAGRYNTSGQMKQELKQVLFQLQKGRSRQQRKENEAEPAIGEAGWISLLSVFYFLLSLFIN